MKTALLIFKKPEESFDGEYLKTVTEILAGGGIDVDTLEVLSSSDISEFRKSFLRYKSTANNLLIIGGEEASFSVKEMVAEDMNTRLSENDNAFKFVEAVANANGEYADEELANLPIDAILVPNVLGQVQGFMLEDNVFTLIVLPKPFEELKAMINGYVTPYFETKYDLKRERFTFKYFGEIEILLGVLDKAEEIYGDGFIKNLKTVYGDTTVNLIFDGGKDTLEVKRYIITEIGENIYAEFDTTLESRLFDLLKLKNAYLSVAESFTGGRIVSSIIKNSGVSKYLHEGIVSYSNESKKKRLSVSEESLKSSGAVSFKVAYEMCAGLLRSGANIAISTTGIAGPNSDDTNKPVGLAYIGVGRSDGVHVHKYVFKGNREEITETAKNTALFLAIKKLKSI